MSNQFSSRREQWQPKNRPEWVQRINDEGRYLDIKSVVPLDENTLLSTAKANTGLDDFGDDNWHESFQVLVKSFDEESELNLMGRLMTRAEILLYLEARLQIEDTYKRYPEINEEEIHKPLFIIGQGRTGTSVLQNMLAMDPNNGVTTTWEAYYPCPPPEKATYHTDSRIEKTNNVHSRLNRVIPEIETMHEFSAKLPTENIQMHCLSFQSPAWLNTFGGQVPSYNAYIAKCSPLSAYQYEKRVLKLLQWKNPRKHWVLKSPASIVHLPEIREVYPDVGFIWTHRDPVKALSSMVNLIGTLFWSRSDKPFIGGSLEVQTNAQANAMALEMPIDWLESGALPSSMLCNIQYQDFVRDPLQVVHHIYDYFGIEMTSEGGQAMSQYMADNPRSSRPTHSYDAGKKEQVDSERNVFARYQKFFNVSNEI